MPVFLVRQPKNKGEPIGENLSAVPLLLGLTKIESTVKYLGVEVDDALWILEQVDI